jgi:phospholipid/cholesterol/gamma-HCH transport system substrate-binding protein/paraquat-inducible protein B
MSTKANYFKIGIFVVIVTSLLIVGIIVLSAGLLDVDKVHMETYLDESVKGLSIGSPVTHLGVQIGHVEELTFVPQEYELGYDTERFLKYSRYVIIKIAVNKSTFSGIPDDKIRKTINRFVKKGFRFKLSYQGITGIGLLEAAFVDDPNKYPPMEIIWEPKRIYVPSVPSTLTSLTESVDSIFEMLKNVDIVGISRSLDEMLKSLDKAVKDLQIRETREELVKVMEEIEKTNKIIQSFIDDSQDNKDTPGLRTATIQFEKTLKTVEQFISTQQSDFEEIMINMRMTSANLTELTEQAKRYPSQVLFGAPPKHSEVEK